jgi:hypothetical protein
MSCRHGCDPCVGWPAHGFYYGRPHGDPEGFEGEWRPPRQDDRRRESVERERGTAMLEARLDGLQAELLRIEAMLAELRRPATPHRSGPHEDRDRHR